MPAGVIVIDGRGIVKQANALARQLLGEPLEEQLWRHIIGRSFRPRADDGHEVSLHDGRRVKLSITPLIDEPGQLIVITDLTETRKLQARISHMQRLSSLGKMVASLAHQIRTPLSAALLYASNLKHAAIATDKREKFTDRLVDRLRELEDQVNDMLLFAKSGNDQVLSPIEVTQLLSDAEQNCDAMLQQSGVELLVELDDHVGQSTILANTNALNGALVNLIHNAVQVSPKGGVIRLQAMIDHKSRLRLQLSDQGKGIPETALTKIFEPFYTTKTNGTGLGLAVVHAAIKAHSGSVSARNLESGGAMFTVLLPLHQGNLKTLDAEKSATEQE
jgi:two-component system sensor histidine kinase FlrB